MLYYGVQWLRKGRTSLPSSERRTSVWSSSINLLRYFFFFVFIVVVPFYLFTQTSKIFKGLQQQQNCVTNWSSIKSARIGHGMFSLAALWQVMVFFTASNGWHRNSRRLRVNHPHFTFIPAFCSSKRWFTLFLTFHIFNSHHPFRFAFPNNHALLIITAETIIVETSDGSCTFS